MTDNVTLIPKNLLNAILLLQIKLKLRSSS